MTAAIRKSIKISGACLFFVYMAGLIYFLFLSEEYGRGAAGMAYNYNLCPFREIRRYLTYWEILGFRAVFLNLAGNVIGFMPFGALLPILSRNVRKAWKAVLLSFEVSALIEVSQLIFQVGCFDVDDIILNTLGGLLGYIVFWVTSRWYFRIEKRQ
ncbi:MAG: VanZ family protein [Lachnospiraceae bacterium]|nr:VanZ family protein [Lachnospiraceae bacterium]